MANNLFISYDLHSPGQNYESVAEAIKGLGNWAKIQYSFWYVRANLSASEAANQVWRRMDSNDSLIVIDASNNDAAWYNLNPQISDFIKNKWSVYQYG